MRKSCDLIIVFVIVRRLNKWKNGRKDVEMFVEYEWREYFMKGGMRTLSMH